MGMALGMWISFIFLTSWIPAHWKRRAVGAGLITDISMHVLLQTLFGGDAAGRAAMLFAGILINVTMHIYKRFCGYEKLTTAGWVRYEPSAKRTTS